MNWIFNRPRDLMIITINKFRQKKELETCSFKSNKTKTGQPRSKGWWRLVFIFYFLALGLLKLNSLLKYLNAVLWSLKWFLGQFKLFGNLTKTSKKLNMTSNKLYMLSGNRSTEDAFFYYLFTHNFYNLQRLSEINSQKKLLVGEIENYFTFFIRPLIKPYWI